jgi:predicted PurR-regulated permease PerM
MEKMFYTVVRWIGLSVASVAMLVVIGGGIITCQQFTGVQGDIQTPEVAFNDFKAFKNHVPDTKENTEDALILKEKKDLFYKNFDKQYAIILKNITSYARSVNQVPVNTNSLEEYLFKLLSKYDYDLRNSYLEQLSAETENLAAYGNEIKEGVVQKTIEWTSFLNWFENDFDSQLLAELDKRAMNETDVITIESSMFTMLAMIGITFVVLMFLIMMLLLLKIESNTRKEDVAVEETEEETTQKK